MYEWSTSTAQSHFEALDAYIAHLEELDRHIAHLAIAGARTAVAELAAMLSDQDLDRRAARISGSRSLLDRAISPAVRDQVASAELAAFIAAADTLRSDI
jgi:hypothetical protein